MRAREKVVKGGFEKREQGGGRCVFALLSMLNDKRGGFRYVLSRNGTKKKKKTKRLLRS